MTNEEILEIAKEADSWLRSKEGRESLKQSLDKCRERIKELKEQRKVDPSQLDDPMTI